jgi:hypothetical protein
VGFLILNHDADAFRQEIYIRDLNLEFTNLKLAESVTSAQAATATLYKDWQEIKLAEITPQNRLTSFLSSTRTQREKLRKMEEMKRQQVVL